LRCKKGSLVVNSSQGGGTKDSWVLDDWYAKGLPCSRSANGIFWLFRNLEQAENTAAWSRRASAWR